jgi:diaminopimelate epimerase
MVASGNDFIVIDHRKPSIKNPKLFTKKVCSRNFGVGADGVLLMERSKKADIRMRIINLDGSEAEMCGNGARCAALYAHKQLGLGRKFLMETKAGIVSCEIKPWTVQVQLTNPVGFRELSTLNISGREVPYYFVNTGVPHVVVLEDDLDAVPVVDLGRAIRYHEHFQPRGTNVNFVACTGPHSLRVRTYERGVENETLACGTGSTASAVMAALAGRVKPPVEVKTSGGEALKINFQLDRSFKLDGSAVSNVTLEGAAEFIFEGSLLNV